MQLVFGGKVLSGLVPEDGFKGGCGALVWKRGGHGDGFQVQDSIMASDGRGLGRRAVGPRAETESSLLAAEVLPARTSCHRRGSTMIIAGLLPSILASWLSGCALPDRGCDYPLPGPDRPA